MVLAGVLATRSPPVLFSLARQVVRPPEALEPPSCQSRESEEMCPSPKWFARAQRGARFRAGEKHHPTSGGHIVVLW